MSKKVLELRSTFGGDKVGEFIAHTWFTYHSQRQEKVDEWKELRNYIFATDTTTTTNRTLPWKNSTTLPKLCQIRDNLHSNYLSALFPNDDWLKWIPYSQQDAIKQKRDAIQAYMANKTREGHFRSEISKLLLDYIDYGNCFATVDYEASYRVDATGEKVSDYIGPRVRRISPLDIVFNPLAQSFKDSFKVIRSIRNVGELHLMADQEPDNAYLQKALKNRSDLFKHMNAHGLENMDKDEGFMIDGFGSYQEYLQSGSVEFLDFYGDIFNPDTGTVSTGRVVTVVDRMWVIRDEPIPNWSGHAPIYHTGWRSRSDNLWAMGPLDNLVGMQYRIDHLENLKSDAMDLAVLPPLVIAGEVEQFEYRPGAEIHIDENGTVTELAKNVQWVIQADNAINILEMRMEQYAGAPREAMGIRTPGEKTAFEVQSLQNAGGRIFQEKITTFETELLERVLNAMLEVSRRNLDMTDVVRVIDDDIGVTQFLEITRDDIIASGTLRPIGARHFAAQAQLLQNLTGVYNTQLGQVVLPHTSGKNMAKLLEDVLGLGRYDLFSPNAAVIEGQETQRLIGQAQEDLDVERSGPQAP